MQLPYITRHCATLITLHQNYDYSCNYTTSHYTTLHYTRLRYTRLHYANYTTTTTATATTITLHYEHHTTTTTPLHYITTTTTAALHHTTSSSCGWGNHCHQSNHFKKPNFNHLSVHRSAIHASQQFTSPIVSNPWNFRHLLARH